MLIKLYSCTKVGVMLIKLYRGGSDVNQVVNTEVGVMLIKLYRGGSDVNQVVQRWE